MTTFGKVSLDKDNPVATIGKDGIAMSPHLQQLCLMHGSKSVPTEASSGINETFGQKLVSPSQVNRLLHLYGRDGDVLDALKSPLGEGERAVPPSGLGGAGEVIYAQMDGGMVLTDEGWREVKTGRVFHGAQVVAQGTGDEGVTRRNRVFNSEYFSSEGHFSEFVGPFGELLRAHIREHPNAQPVFVTDGAPWMRDWIASEFPDAVAILDFYHAFEHLCDFAKLAYGDGGCEGARREWKGLLYEGRVDELLEAIGAHEADGGSVGEAARVLIGYLSGNRERVRYDEFREKGYSIGSGAIESSVKAVVQQRCKLSGQRWGKHLQPILNIRSIYKSGKGKRMHKIINKHFSAAA